MQNQSRFAKIRPQTVPHCNCCSGNFCKPLLKPPLTVRPHSLTAAPSSTQQTARMASAVQRADISGGVAKQPKMIFRCILQHTGICPCHVVTLPCPSTLPPSLLPVSPESLPPCLDVRPAVFWIAMSSGVVGLSTSASSVLQEVTVSKVKHRKDSRRNTAHT